MILDFTIVISQGISNPSANYEKVNKSRKMKLRKKMLTTTTTIDEDVTTICDVDSDNHICRDSHWVVDSSALYHVTSCRDVFSTYMDHKFGNVKMEYNPECKIVGIGHVDMNTFIVCKLCLKDVRHVSKMCFNLIFIGTLEDMRIQ